MVNRGIDGVNNNGFTNGASSDQSLTSTVLPHIEPDKLSVY